MMKTVKKTIENTKLPNQLLLATLLGLSISSSAIAADSKDAKAEKPVKAQKAPKAAAEKMQSIPIRGPQVVSADEDMTIDPAKRLTLKNFTRGLGKLHEYLANAVEKANDEDKKFLVKEKLEIERQKADPKKAYDELFIDMDKQLARMEKAKIFRPILIAKVRKHFMQTEAAIAASAMRAEAKQKSADNRLKGEVEYQLGIIAERDMVNYKTALRHYSKAVGFSPGELDYVDALGRIYLIIEESGSAQKLYKEVVTQLKAQSAPTEIVKIFEDKLAQAVKQLKMAKQ